jgi:predicted DNA-binding transcriptional regulator YafY
MPGLDPQAALALRLCELHLERALPKSTFKALQPHLQAAKKALEGKPVAKWLDKVRLVSRSQPLLPPKASGDVTGVVHEALLESRQIEAKYRSRAAPEAKTMTLHPLGIVHRDSVAYLVATAYEYKDPRLYPLHRFDDATMLPAKAKQPAGFDLDKYIADGELSYRFGAADIHVELVFEKEAGNGLEETPLSSDQVLTHEGDVVRVTARIPDTQVLRSWLLGFGEKVEVVKPSSLRKAIGDAHVAAIQRNYN